jgi:hypothetical protein
MWSTNHARFRSDIFWRRGAAYETLCVSARKITKFIVADIDSNLALAQTALLGGRGCSSSVNSGFSYRHHFLSSMCELHCQ